ncbi:MAG: ParA family protein [Gammaproteobacteria bacterium]|nr:ParA family protein [Gammaproteobacteria bacterium]
MTIISVLGNKGGCGKTTLSVNIASCLAENNATTLLDADRQQSSSHWYHIGGDKLSLQLISSHINLSQALEQARDESTHVIIDCPPSVKQKNTLFAIRNSDWVLIPVLPSPLDIWTNVDIENEISKAQITNPKLKAMFVINQFDSRTTLSKAIRTAIEQLSIPVAETAIKRRIVYATSILDGKSVFQSSGSKAARAEIQDLIKEMGLLS